MSRSNSKLELEEELTRLKADHDAQLAAVEQAAAKRNDALTASIQKLQSEQKIRENDIFTLETRLRQVEYTLQCERAEQQQQKQQLQRIQTENNQIRAEAEKNRLITEPEHDSDRVEELRNEIAQLQQKLLDHTKCDTRLKAAQEQIEAHQRSEQSIRQELAQLREENAQLELKLSEVETRSRQQPPATLQDAGGMRIQQLEKDAISASIRKLQLEQQNASLLSENQTLQEHLDRMQVQLNEVTRWQPPRANSSTFATHVDLKRENFQLRTQIEELKQLQHKYLSSGKKRLMHFPAL